jgi:hypothetical protein
MDTQPKIPTLKDSQKPQVKVRGLEAGVTLFDRLKQFKKKDLAFILAGMGTLFMAPLAEHFMMSPETGASDLQAGWGKGGNKGPFDGSGSNVYEPGTSGLAPGGPTGGGSDIITPLNVRDPSALVMGPGATQQPPTQSVMPPVPPPSAPTNHSDSDLKDALAASARGIQAGAKAAAKTLLPVPKIALGGSGGLRGLGVVSGGSSASAGGGAPSSAGLVSGKANTGGGLTNVKPAAGYGGVARGQTNGGSGGLDKLKAAADAAAAGFNKGSAATALDTAANAALPSGGTPFGGGGAGSTGSTDKANGGDSAKDSKSVGESLAFLKQKAMQEAQIALWAKEQEASDRNLEANKILNTSAESLASSIFGAVGTGIGNCITNNAQGCMGQSSGTPYTCASMDGSGGVSYPIANVAPNIGASTCGGLSAGSTSKGGTPQLYFQGGGIYSCSGQIAKGCSGGPTGGGSSTASTTPAGPQGSVTNTGAGLTGDMMSPPANGLGQACSALIGLAKDPMPSGNVTLINTFVQAAAQYVKVRDAVDNSSNQITQTSQDCNNTGALGGVKGPASMMAQVNNIAGPGNALMTDLPTMDNLATTSTDPKDAGLQQLGKDVGTAAGPGIAANITTFLNDETAVKAAQTAAQTALNAAGTALTPAALDAGFNAAKATKAGIGYTPATIANVEQQIAGAVSAVNAAAKVVDSAVINLETAKTALGPSAPGAKGGTDVLTLLAGSVGTDGKGASGTLGQVVTVNSAMDKVGDPTSKGMSAVKDPLVPPKIDSTKSQVANGMTPSNMAQPLSDATSAVQKADGDVKAFKSPGPSDATNPNLATYNQDLQDAGTKVSAVQADQVAVDAAIKAQATAAFQAVQKK